MSIREDIYNAMLAYWDFDVGDPKTTLVDRSGNVDVPFVGSTPSNFTLISGLQGKAGDWAAGSSGFLKTGLGQYFDIRNRNFIISIWYEGGSSSVGSWLFFESEDGATDQVRVSVSGGNINFILTGSINHSLNEPIKTTAGWHHVLMGLEHGVKRVLYHDGVLAQSSTSGVSGFEANYGRVEIAGADSTSNPEQPLDEILVAEIAPTDEIAEWLYNEGSGKSWAEIQPIPDEQEIFQASFEDASGRDPLPTALLERTPARQLANHYVNVYRYPPYWATKRLPVEVEEYDLCEPGEMMWHQDDHGPAVLHGPMGADRRVSVDG